MAAKLAFLMFLLFGAINIYSLVHGKQPHRKVLILGAGLSGIVAGKTLQDNGIDDILILEGQDYIGGRIKKGSFAGYTIDQGANWIHYAKDEAVPMWKLKQSQNVKGMYSNYSDIIVRNETGADVTNMAVVHKIHKVFKKIDKELEGRKKERKSPIPSRVGLALLGWKPKTAVEYAVEYMAVDFENAKEAELVPFDGLVTKKGTDYFVTDERGIFSLYKDFYNESRIKLKTTVTSINYNSSIVKVTTQNGETYTADFVLCTFSTGVLASDMVKFSPPLPQWKQEAILKMPMSVYTKIYLKFPKKFWDDKEYILFAGPRRGVFPIFQDLERPGMYPTGSGMLLITVTSNEGRRIEKQSFEETKKEIVKMLRGVYGQNVPEPTDIFYSRWSLNPYVRGSYSDGCVGMSEESVADLAKHLGNLYFAGEATAFEWYGYMQGAYISGETKAKAIAKVIKCKETGQECPTTRSSSRRLNPSMVVVYAAVLVWMVHNTAGY